MEPDGIDTRSIKAKPLFLEKNPPSDTKGVFWPNGPTLTAKGFLVERSTNYPTAQICVVYGGDFCFPLAAVIMVKILVAQFRDQSYELFRRLLPWFRWH